MPRFFPCCCLILALSACGDDGGRASASASGGASAGSGALTGIGEMSSGTGDGASASEGEPTGGGSASATSAPTSGTEDEGGGSPSEGPKFDVGTPPDAAPVGCDTKPGGGEEYSFSYIWIANTEAGMVSKIDTKTGVVEGRYRTSNGSNSPSRTTVNQFGDVVVGNRGNAGSVTMVASLLSRCVDMNGDGVITTSTGENDVKAWGEDECVLWNVPVPADFDHGPRAVAWEGGEIDPVTCENTVPNPRVWVGYDGSKTYEVWRLNGATGAIEDQVSIPDTGGRPYGGAVNAKGDFWMAVRGGPLVFIDAQTLQYETFTTPGVTYGMGVDKNGDPWIVTYNSGPGKDRIYRLDTQTKQWVDAGGTAGYYRGMQIDREDRVWVAGNNPCRLILVDGKTDTLVNDNIPLPNCGVPVGISIDVDGYVWVVDQTAHLAYKVDPVSYQVMLIVPNLSGPYTYSDMTGNGLQLVIHPPG